MNTRYLLISALAVLFACTAKQEDNKDGQISADVVSNPLSASDANAINKELPEMTFVEESFDFGKIKQGEKVSHIYKFKNTGKSDLIISDASSSCGCTIPEYPKEPVKPGAEGQITVVFNSENKSGKQHKTVSVVINSIPNIKTITINGEVVKE